MQSQTKKVVFVPKSSKSSGYGQLGCIYTSRSYSLFAFKLGLSSGRGMATEFGGFCSLGRGVFHDFVNFNGWIFVVDLRGHIYLVDNLQLVRMTQNSIRGDSCGRVTFVVSDGDLYLVWKSSNTSHRCQIYRLVVITDGNNSKCSDILIEQVEDLGDRVFFITPKCSFSISAQLLPHPWEKNCIFFSVGPYFLRCRCPSYSDDGHTIFYLRGQTFTKISLLQGYSNLFSPPASFIVNWSNTQVRFWFFVFLTLNLQLFHNSIWSSIIMIDYNYWWCLCLIFLLIHIWRWWIRVFLP